MKRVAIVLLLLPAGLPAFGQSASFHLVPDVPADLSGSTRLPWEVLFHDAGSGAYSSTLLLPGDPPVDALHRLDSGDWLLSVETPATLGGTTYDPRDLVRYDGASFSLFLDGAAAGIPEGSDVDAAFLDGGDAGDPVLSFDVPTTIGATTYDPADLVRFSGGGFSLFFDAGAAGVPAASDVIGADLDGSDLVLTFDVPTDLGGSTYLPGQLVAWNGAAFSLRHADPAWPPGSRIHGLSLPAAAAGPGAIPPTLAVTLVSATMIRLSWGASCSAGAADYGIYEGEIGNWYSHTLIDCADDDGDLAENVTAGAGDRYYLVVPHDGATEEGSYGLASSGPERPAGAAACAAAQAVPACP